MVGFVFKSCGNVFILGFGFVIMRLSNAWAVVISVLGVGILLFVFSSVLFFPVVDEDRCVEVNRASGFVYDACYDSSSESIFMLVEGSMSEYDFSSFGVVFFDSQFRKYELIYEDVDASQLYKFGADGNPGSLNLTLNVEGEFEFPICEASKNLLIKDCLSRSPGWGEGSLNGSVIRDYAFAETSTRYNVSDFADSEIKEEVWRSFCESDWDCSEWGNCEDGLQYRDCVDKNNCFASLDIPKAVRFCGEQCIESWVCDWSECIDGFTTPTCFDENNCGTSYIFPPKVSCVFEEECRPRISCEDWVGCDFDYDLLDLSRDGVGDLEGVKTRVCRDLNGCVEPLVETRDCAMGVDVYTNRFVECGEMFVGIYNSLDDSLIARIGGDVDDNSSLNIYLDEDVNSGSSCWFCSNGILDGDEEDIDCGGSCGACFNEPVVLNIEKGFWDKVFSFLG